MYNELPLVVITGGSSGIGQALAKQYLQAGYQLALWGRNIAKMQTWMQQNNLTNSAIKLYQVDVTDAQQVIATANNCIKQQAVPEIVIACAGISVGVDTAEFVDIKVFEQIYLTNVFGLYYTFHAFVRAMREKGGGKLVGIASVGAIRGLPGHGGYCASKAAVVSYCESLRVELKRYALQNNLAAVKVVTLLPGFVATPLTAQNPYKMPFLLQPEQFAIKAYKAIDKAKSYAVIPWQMALVSKAMRCLPNWLYDKIVLKRKNKPRVS